jgi:hypothetical protein
MPDRWSTVVRRFVVAGAIDLYPARQAFGSRADEPVNLHGGPCIKEQRVVLFRDELEWTRRLRQSSLGTGLAPNSSYQHDTADAAGDRFAQRP